MKEEYLEPDEQTFSAIISSSQATGEWQHALGVLRQMVPSSSSENNTTTTTTNNSAKN